MTLAHLLIANRGEIAVRIARAAAELRIPALAVYSEDDANSLHAQAASEALALNGSGPRAYLDAEQIVALAVDAGCDSVHPGYGFLAESPAFAAKCAAAGLTFVGPKVETLELLGDKARARAFASQHNVPVLAGSEGPVTAAQARAFLEGLGADGAVVLKAVSGGGGRGMRVVSDAAAIDEAYARCQSEAKTAFGNASIYVERLVPRARHLEVQVIGDDSGAVCALGERECSVQRRHQKLIEIAPSPWIDAETRRALTSAALRLAQAAEYRGLGTFEFLVDFDTGDHAFIEANARLQVEHTVTEEVTGIDLVQAQLRVAGGESLASIGLSETPAPRGYALQARVNLERMQADGGVRPSGGRLSVFQPPSGPGIRVDTYGYAGYATNPSFDSLLAKVIAHTTTADIEDAARRAELALGAFQIAGAETNIEFLRAVIDHDDFVAGAVHTRWVDENAGALLAAEDEAPATESGPADPLAGLDFYRSGDPGGVVTMGARGAKPQPVGPPNTTPLRAPIQGTIRELLVGEGDIVREGQTVCIMDALKMEHLVRSDLGGILRHVAVAVGEIVYEDHPLVFIEEADVGGLAVDDTSAPDPDYIRPDLQAVLDRRVFLLDEHRPAAVERRHANNRRTVRENLADLVDDGTWIEYGDLVIAAQSKRYPLDELVRKTPADGLVAGIGSVNGDLFDEKRARTVVVSYDDTVFAGTQGIRGHSKTDRIMEVAEQFALPLIFIAEGAGGRSGDTDGMPGMVFRTWEYMARLSGTVPMVGVTAGRCFAGNAAILGICDVIIATEDANIGMGGPAVIEGGGMGVYLPEEIGPMSDQVPAGTVDVVVKTEAEAIATAKQYLSYFQGSIEDWECGDQRLLRHAVPENRLSAYDVRAVIELLADTGSMLELRTGYGNGMVTAFVRIEGRPVGIIANNNEHLGGSIESFGSDKAARFAKLCDSWNIPICTLVDTPGMMIGPEAEKTALVRRTSNLIVTLGNVKTPRFSVVLRKCYGLGSNTILFGNERAPSFTVAWPTAEFGGMNLEAAVRLGARDQLAAIDDLEERAALYEKLVAEAYERGGPLRAAETFRVDSVVDPMETRHWITQGLLAAPESEPIRRGRRPSMPTW